MAIDADKIIHAFQTDPARALDDLRAEITKGGRAALETLRTDPNARNFAYGAGVGALGGLLAGRANGKFTDTAARLGGLAALGGLAWYAYRQYLTSKGRAPAPPLLQNFDPPPEATKQLLPAPENAAAKEAHAKLILRCMIAAAKADGKVDADERAKIFERLGLVPLNEDEQLFLFTELSQPVNLDALAAAADTPEKALQAYTAAVIAVDPDTPAERDFLSALAAKLKIDPDLAQQIRKTAAEKPGA